jgi:Tol biopolymer transport system component/DNA-binding winged helix-turn-helix (wHTH) protein
MTAPLAFNRREFRHNDRARMRPTSWIFGPFEFNAATFRLSREGRAIPLEPKAVDVLRLLIERAPAVVEKSEIFDTVWKDVAVTDNALTRVVAHLRRALDDDAKHPTYIETVATRGYRMAADVHAVETSTPREAPVPVTPEAAVAERPAPSADHSVQAFRLRPVYAALIATALVLAALFAWRWSARTGAPGDAARTATADPDVTQFAALRPVQVTTGSGFDGYPAFSPDGTSVAFASDRTGALEIYVQGMAPGSVPLALTRDGRQNLRPSWSPDGQLVAYHEAGGGIWVVPSRGGTARRLTDTGARPAWSPDGRYIAFHTLPQTEVGEIGAPGLPSTIQLVDVASGEIRALTQPGRPSGPHLIPSWSADGSRVYFVTTPATFAGEVSFWSVDLGNGAPRLEAHSTEVASEYALAPGERGAYVSNRATGSIWWLPFRTGEASAAARPTGLPVEGRPAHLFVSRDGRRLAWTSLDVTSRLWARVLDDGVDAGGEPHPLPLSSGMRAVNTVAAPDGRLAYSGSVRGGLTQLWVGMPSGPARQVTVDEGEHYSPIWLPGARQLVYIAAHDGVQAMCTVDIETGIERQMFDLSDLPVPAGETLYSVVVLNVLPSNALTHIVFAAVKDGVPNLWKVALENGRPVGPATQLTFEAEGGAFPHWSPDDRWIAYQCVRDSSTQVCVIGSDGTGRRQLTTTPGQQFIGGWKGNDEILVAALHQQIWNIVRVATADGRARRVTDFSQPNLYVRYPNWDPVSRQVIFERGETTGRVWNVELP